MKRTLMIVLAVITVSGIGAALLLLGSTPATARPGYTLHDIEGEYFLILTEVRYEPGPVLNFCEHYGTMVLDGIGGGTMTGTSKCSVTGSGTKTSSVSVSMLDSAIGSYTVLTSFDPPGDFLRMQIVDHGRGLLIDGTLRTNPSVVILNGVAMKR